MRCLSKKPWRSFSSDGYNSTKRMKKLNKRPTQIRRSSSKLKNIHKQTDKQTDTFVSVYLESGTYYLTKELFGDGTWIIVGNIHPRSG